MLASRHLLAAALAACLALTACSDNDAPRTAQAPSAERVDSRLAAAADLPAPPVADQRPYDVEAPHGAVRSDEYYWLRDDTREDPEMLAYLEAENAYADAVMAPLAEVEEALFQELIGRIRQDDSSVPYRHRDYWYYTRFETGQEYPIHARRRGSMDAPEEVMLDVNALAADKAFYQVANWEVSPDQRLLAYAEDDVGRRQYTIRVKDLETGELLPVEVRGASASIAWAGDSGSFFWVENDPVTLLSKRVRRHEIGAGRAEDALVYEEPDDSFYMGVGTTTSEAFVCIHLQSTVSNEMRCAPSDDPVEFTVFAPRERDFEYSADHLAGRWVVRTNFQAPNFRLMQVADADIGDRARWTDLVAHDADVFISRFDLFDDFIAIGERSGGLTRVRILPEEGEAHYVTADESAYTMALSVNADPSTDWVRYVYSSLTTPTTTYELNVKTGERRTLKVQEVLGGFDAADYRTERLWATARDGTQVPVTVLYREGFQRDGTAAMLQYAYGSYGSSSDPSFNHNAISLVDRGMVYAIAHVRGGQEMGRHWYEDGKLLNKMNTFTDFIDVTRFLVAEGWAAPDRVAAMGGSAGGLLMGAIANKAPQDYRVILSLVPFVDVVTTMLDESIPLTTNEFDEWGNPADPVFYEYMLAYSPYDNISAQDYPAMFIGTGLWDSQVQYWEPAKYVARLRATRTNDSLVVFRTQMEAGHGGRSGRFQRFREWAESYAFMFDQLGVAQ